MPPIHMVEVYILFSVEREKGSVKVVDTRIVENWLRLLLEVQNLF